VVFGAVRMEDVIYSLNDIRVFWVLFGTKKPAERNTNST